MRREIHRTMALGVITLVVALTIVSGVVSEAHAQDAKTPYPNMAPLEQYLTERNTEIALARSAAPESISSREAEVISPAQHGYEIAAEGKNGFVCMVERSPRESTIPIFGIPSCGFDLLANLPATRSYLPLTIKKTEWVLAGRSKAQMFEELKAAFDPANSSVSAK